MLNPFRERGLRGLGLGLLLALVSIPLLYVCLPLGYALSWINFTYGANGLDPEFKRQVPQLALIWLAATYGFTVLAYGGVLRGLLLRFSLKTAVILLVGGHNAVFFGAQLAGWHWNFGMMGMVRGLILENLLMLIWIVLFLRSGSPLVAALAHGASNILRYIFMNDAAGPVETLYFYSIASEDYAWLMISMALFCLSVLVWTGQRWGFYEIRKDGYDV